MRRSGKSTGHLQCTQHQTDTAASKLPAALLPLMPCLLRFMGNWVHQFTDHQHEMGLEDRGMPLKESIKEHLAFGSALRDGVWPSVLFDPPSCLCIHTRIGGAHMPWGAHL